MNAGPSPIRPNNQRTLPIGAGHAANISVSHQTANSTHAETKLKNRPANDGRISDSLETSDGGSGKAYTNNPDDQSHEEQRPPTHQTGDLLDLSG